MHIDGSFWGRPHSEIGKLVSMEHDNASRKRTKRAPGWIFVCALAACTARSGASAKPNDERSAPESMYTQLDGTFPERRAGHQTTLRADDRPPAQPQQLHPPDMFEEIRYRSGDLELKAWYAAPLADSAKRPGVVYFHGDFALRQRTFAEVEPFIAQGFAVLLPTLRAENGNPGRFELLYGEVEDARAAVRWLAARPEVQEDRIYAFGHSIGGGIAALLSLYPEPEIVRTGSSGGIYVPDTFLRWSQSGPNKHLIRFDPTDPLERTLRVLGPNISDMVHPHVAYVGNEDTWFVDNSAHVQTLAKRHHKPFTVEHVAGDHMTALAPSIADFAAKASSDVQTR